MSPYEIAMAIRHVDFFTAFRQSRLMYPIVMSTHLTCIAIFGGMILMTDLRLLGAVFKEIPASEVIARFRWWKRAGFIVMVSCGIMLAGSKFDEYYNNPYFIMKMFFLAMVAVHAIVFHGSVYGRNAGPMLDKAPALPRVAKLAGAFSLLIWLTILCFGRWIAYWAPPRSQAQAAATYEITQPRRLQPAAHTAAPAS